MTLSCNICGSEKFGPGPGGRKSVNDKMPGCLTCGSLERHRGIRDTFERIKALGFAEKKVLQFSKDQSTRPEWFASHEVSIYEGDNSLDLTNIDRADESYGLVICNHVLEHVQDDRKALREICRLLQPEGFAFLSFPDPKRRRETTDWGFPDWDDHGHYRRYGQDVIDKIAEELPHAFVLVCTTVDPVTDVEDLVYFICRSEQVAHQICNYLPADRIKIGHQPQPV